MQVFMQDFYYFKQYEEFIFMLNFCLIGFIQIYSQFYPKMFFIKDKIDISKNEEANLTANLT